VLQDHLSQPPSRRPGLPLWVLPATLPLALSLGFVVGMAVANRLDRPIAAPTPHQTESAPATATNEEPGPVSADPNPTTPLRSAPLSPARVKQPEPSSGPTTNAPPISAPTRTEGSTTAPSRPSDVYGGSAVADNAPIRTIQDAQLALIADRVGSGPVKGIDYQQMRNTGFGISLVGMLNWAQYQAWEEALRQDPAALERWLTKTAALAFGPDQTDRFAISWALVDTLPSVPPGIQPSEVTPLESGEFLVIRFLAGTKRPGEPAIELRRLDDLGAAAGGQEAWARYGPQIRFDSTDIYRPSGVTGTAPKGQ
jgi:hypothetical protein